MCRVSAWGRRCVAAFLAGVLALQAGCATGPRALGREDLVDPPAARTYLVTTRDGTHHTFVSLHLEGETLVGTARFTVRESVGDGEAARETVSNRYEERRIPWADIQSVEAEREAGLGQGGWLWAAGSVALGLGLFFLITSGDEDPAGGGGGKDF